MCPKLRGHSGTLALLSGLARLSQRTGSVFYWRSLAHDGALEATRASEGLRARLPEALAGRVPGEGARPKDGEGLETPADFDRRILYPCCEAVLP